LAEQYLNLKPEVDRVVQEVLTSGSFVGGKHVQEFEKDFANLCNVKNCVGVGNATDALFLSLKALGIKPGDEVITPAWSWISTSEVIDLCGAKPVFCDVHPEYFTITPESIQEKLTSRTKAVIVVNLYGQVAEIQAIKKICHQNNIFMIEDCSQAHLSKEDELIAGSVGDCGVFSFYPTKNLGAYGDAGCVVTNDQVLAEKVRRLANHGGLTKDEHLFEGTNSRLDTLHAAILNVKLKHLPAWNEKRNANANLYVENLFDVSKIILPKVREGTTHTFHQFVIRASNRNELKRFLAQREVDTLIHYPKALPFEPAYKHLNHSDKDFPVSAMLQSEVLSLPIQPELSKDQILYVCELIKSFYETT